VVFDCCATLLTVASDSPTEEGRVTIEKLKKEGGEIVLFIHCTLYSRALKKSHCRQMLTHVLVPCLDEGEIRQVASLISFPPAHLACTELTFYLL